MRAWRRRCKLTRRVRPRRCARFDGLKTTAADDLDVGERHVALPRARCACSNSFTGRSRPLVEPEAAEAAEAADHAASQFATLLRNWRRAHCLTQAQACVALGLPRDQALISDWESGKAFPRKPRLQQLVAALKQPPASGSGTHNWFAARSNEFGQQLRAWRKARGLRQLDACAVLGLPRDQGLICRYERGEASPRRERMTRMLAIIAGTEVQP